jgi:hypothetical protein
MDLTKSGGRFSWRDVRHIETGSGVHWELGPLRLWAYRDAREWTLCFERGEDALSDFVSVEAPPNTEPAGEATTLRFGFKKSPAVIRLTPALAKRPVVVTPEEPFSLPPKEETTLYISTPVWIGVEVGDPPVRLLEEASHRPSDTWFGRSTRDGELCYATRTRATLELAELPIRVHRAVSVVRIVNRAGSALEIEKIKLPAPFMSLFVDAGGHLWTEEVSLTREQDGELASVDVGTGPPAAVVGAEQLGGAQKTMGRGILDRTFGGLIRELRG